MLPHLRADYSAKLRQATVYRFEEAEKQAIKRRFHELRLLVGDLDSLEEPQKSRLMSRLGRIHAELEHRLSDLDRIWGLVGEARTIESRYGDAGSLIVELLREIVEIGWQAQARAEGVSAETGRPEAPGASTGRV